MDMHIHMRKYKALANMGGHRHDLGDGGDL